MNALQNTAFQRLVEAWRRREDARASLDVREIANARWQLDAARAECRTMHHLGR